MITIIMLSFVGAVISAVIGTFWYSDKTPMGRVHMRYVGFDRLSKDEQKNKIKEAMPKMPKIYAAQMLLSFLMAFFVVFVVTMSNKNGVPPLMAGMFPIFGWLCFTVPTIGSALLWGNCEKDIVWQKFFSDTLSQLVTIIAIVCLTVLFL